MDTPKGQPPRACALCRSPRSKAYSSHSDGRYFECLSCGVIFAHPIPARDALLEQARHWARVHHASPEKTASDFSDFIQRSIHLPRLRRIARLEIIGRLLDLGCATGAFLYAARGEGWDAVGVELAEESAAYGKRERGLDIRVGSFPEVSFPKESFHAITLWEFLEHVHNPLETLRGAFEVMRPGGVLALSTPNLCSLTRVFLGPRWDVLSPRMHLFLFTPRALKRTLQRAGFRKISIVSEDLNPLRIWRNLRPQRSFEEGDAAKWEAKKEEKALLKDLLQRKAWARALRGAMNGFLHLWKAGDTLLAYAKK